MSDRIPWHKRVKRWGQTNLTEDDPERNNAERVTAVSLKRPFPSSAGMKKMRSICTIAPVLPM